MKGIREKERRKCKLGGQKKSKRERERRKRGGDKALRHKRALNA